jgi:lysophospholipase L1-like esterase
MRGAGGCNSSRLVEGQSRRGVDEVEVHGGFRVSLLEKLASGGGAQSAGHVNRRVSWIKLAIYSMLPVLVLVAAGELGLRFWAHWLRTPYERYNPSTGRLELVANTYRISAQGQEFRINSRGFLGSEFDHQKPPGVYRIFAVGDSCTFGAGFWRETYPAILEQILSTTAGAGRFEVINAGIEGYNSEFALDRIRTELLAYQPDMIILYIGWNDLMKIDPRNAVATDRYASLAQVLERSYLAKAYAKTLFYYIRPMMAKPKVGPDPNADRQLQGFVPSRYRTNLEATMELLRERGVALVLVTLPTVVTADMTDEELQQAHVFFPYYPAGYGVHAFLTLHAAYNDVVRKTAHKYGAPLVDLEAAVDRPARHELFWDTMHPSVKGHRLIAEAIAPTVLAISRAATPSTRPASPPGAR